MRASDRDTIVAIATAPGEGAIGIVRLSGPRALDIGARCFSGARPLQRVPDRRIAYGRFVCGDQDLDQVLVSVMRGPGSYTGEDTVEFNCHGGPLLLRRAVAALVEAGARPAQTGEFTRRAFLNGRIDLTQAEAVADMIQARTDLSLQSAYFQLRGGLKDRFEAMAEDLRQAMVLLEAGLDFSEDVHLTASAARPAIADSLLGIRNLLASYRQGKLIREGAVVALVGRPNAGKSSLLNRLLEEERAIVTDVPGTTRDTIEESLSLDGLPVILVDTAGLRDTSDPVEQEGVRRSRGAAGRAQMVLCVCDGSVPPTEADVALAMDLAAYPVHLILNKSDLGQDPSWTRFHTGWARMSVSALTGAGVDELRRSVRETLVGTPGEEILTHERHALALRHAGDALVRALDALDADLPAELISVEIREALDALSEIVGITSPQDVLDRIFSTFCIGK